MRSGHMHLGTNTQPSTRISNCLLHIRISQSPCTLRTCKHVWVALLQYKVVPSVLQAKPTPLGHNASAKAHVIAVDKATRIALLVHHTKVDGVLGARVGGWVVVLGGVGDARCWRRRLCGMWDSLGKV